MTRIGSAGSTPVNFGAKILPLMCESHANVGEIALLVVDPMPFAMDALVWSGVVALFEIGISTTFVKRFSRLCSVGAMLTRVLKFSRLSFALVLFKLLASLFGHRVFVSFHLWVVGPSRL